MSSPFTVAKLDPRDRLDVQSFYRSVGYVVPVEADAVCFGARNAYDALVGAVRLAPEHGVLVLRGMHVRPDVQRLGIGHALLTTLVATLQADCYCLPYGHLAGFYRQFGFQPVAPEDAPPHLLLRLADYHRGDPDIVLVCRRADAVG